MGSHTALGAGAANLSATYSAAVPLWPFLVAIVRRGAAPWQHCSYAESGGVNEKDGFRIEQTWTARHGAENSDV